MCDQKKCQGAFVSCQSDSMSEIRHERKEAEFYLFFECSLYLNAPC